MRIVEIFHSRQGEGLLTGTPSVFVRTSGCNLRCWFCDTPYASWQPEGEYLTVEQIVEKVAGYDCQHIVLTGGEPLIASGVSSLIAACRERGNHLTVETAGTVVPTDLPPVDLMSISPKLSNSDPDPVSHRVWAKRHAARRHNPQLVAQLIDHADDYQLKFVVGSILDAEEVQEYTRELREHLQQPLEPSRLMLMPRATTAELLDCQLQWLTGWAEAHGYSICDRLHIRWYGNTRGT